MKRLSTAALLRAAVVLGILLCLTAAIGAVPAHAESGAGTVTASALNMRAEPSTSSAVVTTVPRGTVVLVLESSDGWYKVRYQGQTGYMSGEYLTFSTDADGAFGSGSVTGNYVNVRSGPGTGYPVLGSVSTGQSFSVTGVSGGWYKIGYNGGTGYISGDYLSVGGSTAPAATPAPGSVPASAPAPQIGGVGVITGNYVRMRSGPSTGYSVLGTYNSGTQMTVTGQSGDWYAVSYNGVSGYVYGQYLSQAQASAVNVTSMTSTPAWTTAGVNLREGPSTAYTSRQVLPAGTSVTLTGKSDNWYRVSYGSVSGFIRQDYVTTSSAPASTTTASSAITSAAGEKIVAEAKKYLGVRYAYGGMTPAGFDCSGFVYYVYRQCGYSVARTATAQSYMGAKVDRSDLQPGDIVIFYNGYRSAIGHAGIYVGNNQFIHASSGGGKVMISSLSESYYNTRFYSARRVVK